MISDLSNHGTTSLDVMIAKAKIFGFLKQLKVYLLKPTHIIITVTKGDGIVGSLQ